MQGLPVYTGVFGELQDIRLVVVRFMHNVNNILCWMSWLHTIEKRTYNILQLTQSWRDTKVLLRCISLGTHVNTTKILAIMHFDDRNAYSLSEEDTLLMAQATDIFVEYIHMHAFFLENIFYRHTKALLDEAQGRW